MNIKKGLSLVAFGFLFVLVNINLTLNGITINVAPDFVGWILMFMAFDSLGKYVADKQYLKWIAFAEIIVTAAIWLCSIIQPELDMKLIKFPANLVSTFFMFMIFTILESIAADRGSKYTGNIRTLKFINVIVEIVMTVLALFVNEDNKYAIAMAVLAVGMVALVSAVVSAVYLFKLAKEEPEKETAA